MQRWVFQPKYKTRMMVLNFLFSFIFKQICVFLLQSVAGNSGLKCGRVYGPSCTLLFKITTS